MEQLSHFTKRVAYAPKNDFALSKAWIYVSFNTCLIQHYGRIDPGGKNLEGWWEGSSSNGRKGEIKTAGMWRRVDLALMSRHFPDLPNGYRERMRKCCQNIAVKVRPIPWWHFSSFPFTMVPVFRFIYNRLRVSRIYSKSEFLYFLMG